MMFIAWPHRRGCRTRRRFPSHRRRTLASGERLEARAMLSGNEPPVNHVPGPQEAVSGVPLAFTAYLGNPISVSDPDAGGNTVRVSLAVDSGSLTLVQSDPRGGLTYSVGDGVEDAAMTFTGTLADINEALAWLSYRSAAGFAGTATITITTNDLGMVGTGGAKSDTDTIDIEVGPPPAFSPSPSHETLPAVLDTSFNGTGKQVLAISDRTAGIDFIHDIRVLPDGKILAVGAINDRFAIMRFNPDMTLDESFGTAWQDPLLPLGGGFVREDFGEGVHATCVSFDAAGRIVVAGGDRVVRYEADGRKDLSFGADGVYQSPAFTIGSINAIAIRPDGSILAAGGLRLNAISSAGTHLRGWYYGNASVGWIDRLIALQDGDVLFAGLYRSYSSYPDFRFTTGRLDISGTIEETFSVLFGPSTPSYDSPSVNSVLELPDGRFLVVGSAYNDVAVSRHLASGQLDTTFGSSGVTQIPLLSGKDTGYRATLTADGKILVAGSAHNGVNQDVAVVRLDFDGRIDTKFGIAGVLTADLGSDDLGYAVAPLPDGKILVAGRSGNRIALVQLLGDSDPSAIPALPPVAPHEVRVLPGNMANELWISWELPETLNVPFIEDYYLEVSADDGETWQRIDDGVSLDRYASLPNLDSSLSYSVRVAAVSAAGGGLWSWPSATVRPQRAVMDLVHVGDPGNIWTTNSQGDVLYEYRIGTYEVTIGQYVEFLNAIARTDTYSLYNPAMATDLQVAGIARQGSEGNYSYSVVDNGGSSVARPITYVSWFDAARFANWLHNGRPTGLQGPGTTETGAYTLAGMVTGIPPVVNPTARFSIPTNDQWYKAAYYDPALNSGSGGFWGYATQSDSAPGNLIGSQPNQANVRANGVYAVTQATSLSASQNYLTAAGAFPGSGSHYGTFDQAGNVQEWTTWAVRGANSSARAIGGSSWGGNSSSNSQPYSQPSSYESQTVGFRLAAPYDPQPFAAVRLFAAPIAELAAGSESRPVLAWRMPEPVAEIDLTGFVVQRSDDAGGSWVTVDASLSSDRRSYEFTDLVDGQSYLLRVAARSSAGVGAYSEPAAVTVGSIEPLAIVLSGDTVLERQWYEHGAVVGTLAVVGGQPGDVFSFEITGQSVATVLARRYQLDRFIVDVYRDIHADAIISETQLDELIAPLAQQESARGIADVVGSVRGVLEVSVYDTSGKLLLVNHVVDDRSFEIVGNEVRVMSSGSYGDGTFDREAIGGWEISIRATNQHGTAVEQSVIIRVADVNEPPVAITLLQAAIAENQPTGSVVGEFTATDPDWGDTATYRLVAGEGSADNGWFTISDGVLRAASPFDFEARSSYSIRVRATDRGGLWSENVFTINVTDVEVPPGIMLWGDSVAENQPVGTVVGSLTTSTSISPDAFTYSLIPGSGDADNEAFEIVGNELRTTAVFDYETKSVYAIRVRGVTAAGVQTERAIEIRVVNLGENDTNLEAGLLGHYELGYDAADSSGNGRDGTAVNTVPATDRFGVIGGASGFDGESSIVTVPHDPALNTLPLSISVWFQTTAGGTGGLVGKYWAGNWYGYQLPMNPDGSVTPWYVTGFGQDVIGRYERDGATNPPFRTVPLSDGAWHNLVFTVDESGGALFVDGVLQATKAWRGLPAEATNTLPLTIGRYLGQDNGFFRGLIDDVRIYDRVVSPAEIGLLSSAGRAPTDVGLSAATIAENQPAGSVVGLLSTADPDAGDMFTYSLVDGPGGEDNAFFEIVDTELRAKRSFDFETKPDYSIRVQSTDRYGFAIQTTFTIAVRDVVEKRELVAVPGESLVIDGPITGSDRILIRGGGRVVLASGNTHGGGITVEAGELVIRDPAAVGSGPLVVQSGARVTLDLGGRDAPVASLDVASDGFLDVGTSSIRIADGSHNLFGIRSLIAAARDGGSWSGPGITSSSIQPGSFREIGYQVLPDGSLEVGYAAVGDANMDGFVNVQDLIALNSAGKYGGVGTNTSWFEGDFNYDGLGNINDLIALLSSGLYGKTSYLPVAPAAAANLQATGAAEPVLSVVPTGVTLTGYAAPESQPKPILTETTAAPATRAPEARRVDEFAWAAIASQSEPETPKDRKVSHWRMVGR